MKFFISLAIILFCNICNAQVDSASYYKLIEGIKLESKDAANKKAFDEIAPLAIPVYAKASGDILELRQSVKFAKQKTIPDSQVVNRYNSLLGGVMRKLTTLEAIDKRLQKAGDAYVKVLVLRELARVAFEKSTEAKNKAENLKQ